MDGVIEVADVDYPHGHTNEGDDLQGGADQMSLRRLSKDPFMEAFFVDISHQSIVDARTTTDLGELLSELIQLLLQWRLLLLSGGHLVTNLTDLGGDSCCNSNAGGFTCSNVGPLTCFRFKKKGGFGDA